MTLEPDPDNAGEGKRIALFTRHSCTSLRIKLIVGACAKVKIRGRFFYAKNWNVKVEAAY